VPDHVALGQVVLHLHRQQLHRVVAEIGLQERQERGQDLIVGTSSIRLGLVVSNTNGPVYWLSMPS
jgi:hypothetical protein